MTRISPAATLGPRAPRIEFINPPGLYDPQPNGYTHVVVATAPARFIHVAGQGGEQVDGTLPEGFDAQARQALANVATALAAAHAILADVVRISVLVVDHSQARLAVWGAALARAWGDLPAPACTLIPVPRLAFDGMLVEIEATAVTGVAGDAAAAAQEG